jgi:glycosyltransferase involved in cell wall biosynthesis
LVIIDKRDSSFTPLISIVTATYNAALHLPGLIASIKEQTDCDFEWVVADGASTDGTLTLLNEIYDLNIVICSSSDFGVYDGLNRAIKKASGLYYLVCGADDVLDKNAILNYKNAINSLNADIITSKIINHKNNIVKIKSNKWLYGISAIISSHSVGAVFRRSLHDKYGFYSKLYPICADALFVKLVSTSGGKIKSVDFISGKYSGTGISSTDIPSTLCQHFCINISFGENKVVQIVLLFLRLLKNYFKL